MYEFAKGDLCITIAADSEGNNKTIKLGIGHAALLVAGRKTHSGAKFVAQAVAIIEKQRAKIVTLRDLDDTNLNTNIDASRTAPRTALLKVFKTVPAKFPEAHLGLGSDCEGDGTDPGVLSDVMLVARSIGIGGSGEVGGCGGLAAKCEGSTNWRSPCLSGS